MEYMSITEAAAQWSVSRRRVQALCAAGRIPGLERLGRAWAIPREAAKPTDPRRDRRAEEKRSE